MRKPLIIWLLGLFILLYSVSLFMACHSKVEPPDSDTIQTLVKEKFRAEQRIKEIKLVWPDDSMEFNTGKIRYMKAQEAFNSWITRFIFELQEENIIKDKKQYRTVLNEAVMKANDFVNYIEYLQKEMRAKEEVKERRTLTADTWPMKDKLGPLMMKKEEIINALEELKWNDFDEIKVSEK